MALTDTQKEILGFASEMKTPMIVKGAAGSGKSLITSLITKTFCNREMLIEENCIGVVSFTKTLVRELRNRINKIIPPENAKKIKIYTAHEILNQFLEANNQTRITSFDEYDKILTTLSDINAFEKYKKNFLKEEFSWLCDNRITSLEKYESTPRKGRGQCGNIEKSLIWGFYTEYQKRLRESGLYTHSGLANLCLDLMDNKPNYNKLFTHLIIDEFQDLTKNVIEALLKMCKYPNNVVFVGDLAQSIYKRGISWKDFDINRKKTFELTDNFRNSKQIALAAESLLDNEYKLKLYDRQDYTEMISAGQNGHKPIIAICRDIEEQRWYLTNEIAHIDKKESIAIIRRTKDYENRNGLKGKFDFYTMHSCKGLEFDNVFIIDANEDLLPNPKAIEYEKDWNLANERRLLYVAMTRARKRLFITTSGKPSRFLAEINPTTISPIALDNIAYEELYNTRFEELLNKREEIIKQLVEENKTLINNNNTKDDTIAQLIMGRNFIEDSMREISSTDLNFRSNAKILILGGDGGIREKDVIYTLKKQFGLDKWCYEWIHFDDMQRYNVKTLQGTSSYCDIIVGCVPHNSGGEEDLITEFKTHEEYYPPKIHLLLNDRGKLKKLTKNDLVNIIKDSNKLKMI